MGPRLERRSVMRASRGLRADFVASSAVKKADHLARRHCTASSSGTAVSRPCSAKGCKLRYALQVKEMAVWRRRQTGSSRHRRFQTL